MELENKLYVDMHGGNTAPISDDPPQYTATALDQSAPSFQTSSALGAPYYTPASAALPPQQQVTVVPANNATPSVVYDPYPGKTYTAAIIYSCVVCLCCNCLFGMIAFILAVVAHDNALGDPTGAHRMKRASYAVSSAGIIITILIISVYIGVFYSSNHCYYCGWSDICYHHKASGYTIHECEAKYVGFYYFGTCCWE